MVSPSSVSIPAQFRAFQNWWPENNRKWPLRKWPMWKWPEWKWPISYEIGDIAFVAPVFWIQNRLLSILNNDHFCLFESKWPVIYKINENGFGNVERYRSFWCGNSHFCLQRSFRPYNSHFGYKLRSFVSNIGQIKYFFRSKWRYVLFCALVTSKI